MKSGDTEGLHQDYIFSELIDVGYGMGTHSETYVYLKDEPKATYHGLYGKPVDIDKVWADRESYQND